MPLTKEFLTVSELNALIQEVIHGGFPQPVWVCGEIQGYDRNRGKSHIFFELVEKDPDSEKIIAKIGLVIFSGRKAHINDVLKRSENAFALKDDIEVKFACSVDFYPPHGALRLIVESIDPTYTLGRLAQEKQKLIALLKEKGVFEKNKLLEIPRVPLNVGLVTSDDSAAYNDFYSELEKSGYSFKVFLRNTLMQGAKAEKDICRAVDQLLRTGCCDVIVITRGGGSLADLSCFDSQMIAEKIASCPIPVLSGIGHEINLTVTDMAAHTFAKTPTAIAKFLVDRVRTFMDDMQEKVEHIIEEAGMLIDSERQKLKNHATDLQGYTRLFLQGHRESIIRMREVIRHKPQELINNRRRSLQETQKSFKRAVEGCLARHTSRIGGYEKIIAIAEPANTIKRGFSVTRSADGKVVKSAAAVKKNDRLLTEVTDGGFKSKVE